MGHLVPQAREDRFLSGFIGTRVLTLLNLWHFLANERLNVCLGIAFDLQKDGVEKHETRYGIVLINGKAIEGVQIMVRVRLL